MHYFTYFVFGVVTTLVNCWPDFYLYNHENPVKERKISAPALKKVLATSDCPCYKEFVFIVHGFLQDESADWMHDMKNALLDKNHERSVIIVDWKGGAAPLDSSSTIKTVISAAAGTLLGGPIGGVILGGAGGGAAVFSGAAGNVPENGRKIAEFISASGIDPKKIHCIGHSLGAHSCGFAGKNIQLLEKAKIRRISGLDVAGPGFTKKPTNERLDKEDADFVDVMHTNAANLGIRQAIGHVDFYPNGGENQSGCKNTMICSHSSAHQYYIDSIRDPTNEMFESMMQPNFESLIKDFGKHCSVTACAQMGYGASKTDMEGSYYLMIHKPMSKK